MAEVSFVQLCKGERVKETKEKLYSWKRKGGKTLRTNREVMGNLSSVDSQQ